MSTYTPVADAPPMPSLEPSDHGSYGTCPHCVKAVGLTKDGFLRDHKTPEFVRNAHWKATYLCPGVGRRYAEHGVTPKTWSLNDGDWALLPIEIPVLVIADPKLDGPFPAWRTVEVFQTVMSVGHRERLAAQQGWRIEMTSTESHLSAALIQLTDAGPVVAHEETIDRGQHNAPTLLITKMLAQIELAQDREMDEELGTE